DRTLHKPFCLDPAQAGDGRLRNLSCRFARSCSGRNRPACSHSDRSGPGRRLRGDTRCCVGHGADPRAPSCRDGRTRPRLSRQWRSGSRPPARAARIRLERRGRSRRSDDRRRRPHRPAHLRLSRRHRDRPLVHHPGRHRQADSARRLPDPAEEQGPRLQPLRRAHALYAAPHLDGHCDPRKRGRRLGRDPRLHRCARRLRRHALRQRQARRPRARHQELEAGPHSAKRL
ncbi:MAG: hypothetical protein AVDCRST_MAG23-2445, partial [uncultured Sphingosinicella sp.]